MSCIDYTKLKELNSGSSLALPNQTNDRHDSLMKNLDTIFLKPVKIKPGIPNKPTKSFQMSHAHIKRPKSRFGAYKERFVTESSCDPPTLYDDPLSHDIRFYTVRRRGKRCENGTQQRNDSVFNNERSVTALFSIIQKLPFERTKKEKRKAYKLLQDLWPAELSHLIEDTKTRYPVLKELASIATMDVYPEAGLTVFGNTGLHMILRGSAYPQTLPFLKTKSENAENELEEFPCPTPLLRRKHVTKLTVGDWFGTLEKVEGREVNSKILTLMTSEPCQFLKISTADYQRILTRIKQRIQNEKMSIVQVVAPYNKWPNRSVGKLAALIEWKTFPAGSIVMGEGEIAPYIVFIRQGKCDVYRQVEAMKTLPNGRKRRIIKDVLMDRLSNGDAWGEFSILEQKPFTCTVVATTDLNVGVIFPQKLEELDPTIRTLLSQSVQPKFAFITDDDVHSSFIDQEMKDDWNKLKRKVLLQTINHCGIRPGYGKWSNPSFYKSGF